VLGCLDELEVIIDQDNSVSHTEPDKIRTQIQRHKEFQRTLGAKQSAVDGVTRLGRTIKDKCLPADADAIQGMVTQLKGKWGTICNKAIDR